MTKVAGIRDIQRFRLRGPDKVESVTADLHVANGLGDVGHVAGDALAARTSGRMMRVLLYCRRMRSVLPVRTVALQTEPVSRLAHHPLIFRAVCIVATEAGNPPCVHEAGDEVISLHAVLVRSSVRKVSKGRFSELVLLQLPEVRQIHANLKADRPVVVFSLYRVCQRLALGMTLDAGIVGMHVVEARGIKDRVAHRPVHMGAARSMALSRSRHSIRSLFWSRCRS